MKEVVLKKNNNKVLNSCARSPHLPAAILYRLTYFNMSGLGKFSPVLVMTNIEKKTRLFSQTVMMKSY